MNIQKLLKNIILPLTIILSATSVNAATIFPKLDINGGSEDDGGVVLTLTSFNIINANIGKILTGTGTNIIIDELFNLTTNTGTYSPTSGGTFSGMFTVSGGLLSGTFSNLSLSAPVSPLPGFPSVSTFGADLTYTGGSLQGSLTDGRIEGTFSNASSLLAKLGAVQPVPVPAAVWLFGSGLLGLVGVARRRA